MSDHERDPAVTQLYPAYGLLVGTAIGLLLGLLDLIPLVWALIGGAALGIVVGAAVWAWAART